MTATVSTKFSSHFALNISCNDTLNRDKSNDMIFYAIVGKKSNHDPIKWRVKQTGITV